jgi:hypothetical protein
MNEQFLELAKQAGLKFSSEDSLSPMEQKFAELIVRECAGLLPPDMTHGPDGRPLMQVFNEHFGVKS